MDAWAIMEAMADRDRMVRASRRLSLVLRHRPDSVGLELDEHGWVAVGDLLTGLAAHGLRLDRAELERIVATSDKQRFAFDQTGERIRANQGHSVVVDLGLRPSAPPPLLFHGTVARFLPAIAREGLNPGSRQHVHLSADVATAERVGRRRGMPVVLGVDSGTMSADAAEFFLSVNGVWLTGHVPARYLTLDGRPLSA